MTSDFAPVTGLLATLDLLAISQSGPVLHLQLNRPAKRNAISDGLIQQLHTAFVNLPATVKAVVVSGAGAHFCAGLDLSELVERDMQGAILHSRMWHAAFDAIQFGPVPVVAVLHGAVVGGGLELAAACQIRVAEDSAYFGLPEGQRGIFVGGGGSVRIPRLMGVARMTDMMLTGRVYDADEGDRAGLVQYRVRDGEGLAKGIALAQQDGRQCADDRLCGDACAAAHRRAVARRRPVHRVADGRRRQQHARGAGPAARLPGRPRRQGGEVMSRRRVPRRPASAAASAPAPSSAPTAAWCCARPSRCAGFPTA